MMQVNTTIHEEVWLGRILEEARNKTDLFQMYQAAQDENLRWRMAAAKVSASMAGTDVSTPEAFQKAQLDAITGFLDQEVFIRRAQPHLTFVDVNGGTRTMGHWYQYPFERNGMFLLPVNTSSPLAAFLWRKDFKGLVRRWAPWGIDHEFKPVVWCCSFTTPG